MNFKLLPLLTTIDTTRVYRLRATQRAATAGRELRAPPLTPAGSGPDGAGSPLGARADSGAAPHPCPAAPARAVLAVLSAGQGRAGAARLGVRRGAVPGPGRAGPARIARRSAAPPVGERSGGGAERSGSGGAGTGTGTAARAAQRLRGTRPRVCSGQAPPGCPRPPFYSVFFFFMNCHWQDIAPCPARERRGSSRLGRGGNPGLPPGDLTSKANSQYVSRWLNKGISIC